MVARGMQRGGSIAGFVSEKIQNIYIICTEYEIAQFPFITHYTDFNISQKQDLVKKNTRGGGDPCVFLKKGENGRSAPPMEGWAPPYGDLPVAPLHSVKPDPLA